TYSGGSVFGDAFIAKVDPSGANILYAGYLGGSDDDSGVGIAIDTSNDVYVSGATQSSEATFPVAVGPFPTYDPGNFMEANAFVAKLTGLPGPASDFSVSILPATATGSAGTKIPVTIDITRTGTFTGAVTISGPATLPKGIKVPLDTSPISGNSTKFKLKVKGSAAPGVDQLVFTAKDQSGALVHTATLTLTVQ
ncbi:MAG TPA: SBBP repeat-containing protein, partial [Blastocatellia bacterium]|nr:SBBP repeat-containing protein [Blastocatellia bacterium]